MFTKNGLQCCLFKKKFLFFWVSFMPSYKCRLWLGFREIFPPIFYYSTLNLQNFIFLYRNFIFTFCCCLILLISIHFIFFSWTPDITLLKIYYTSHLYCFFLSLLLLLRWEYNLYILYLDCKRHFDPYTNKSDLTILCSSFSSFLIFFGIRLLIHLLK